ncbi:hypothetical protein BKA63DRAFT_515380 [Paraphoma chrysanthemicola]|nr:hypothetical protein BKA63DRAFT_515380 [Paraphoma chrysanthemicola]
MTDQNPTWPPPSGVTSPTVPHNSQVFTLNASILIHAPASFIFNILLDTSTYPEWCTFIPKVDVISHSNSTQDAHLELGTKMIFHACMGAPGSSTRATPLVVTDLSTPESLSTYIPLDTLVSEPVYTSDPSTVYRVAWASDKTSAFDVGPTAERFHEVIVRGEDKCEVRTWECMGGKVAHVVKWMYQGTLQTKFVEWCRDLREFGERRWVEENDGHS